MYMYRCIYTYPLAPSRVRRLLEVANIEGVAGPLREVPPPQMIIYTYIYIYIYTYREREHTTTNNSHNNMYVSQPEITVVSSPPMNVLYPGMRSTCHGPSWSISDY